MEFKLVRNNDEMNDDQERKIRFLMIESLNNHDSDGGENFT